MRTIFAVLIAAVAIIVAATLTVVTPAPAYAGFGRTLCPVTPCGDVTHDGSVTAVDALAVLRKSVGLDADGNPAQPELCEFTQSNRRGTKVRTRVLGDEGEATECFTGRPVETVR